MKFKAGVFALVLCLLSTCAQITPTPLPTATAPAPSLPPTLTPSLTRAPTASLTAAAFPTPSLAPSLTPFPPLSISFYHIRIDYTLTSDWGSLEFLNPADILTGKLMAVSGSPMYAAFSTTKIELGRKNETINQPPTATMSVDFAISPQAIMAPFSIRSEHGSSMGSSFRISSVVAGKATMIQEISHNWVDANNPETSSAVYSIDLKALQKDAIALETRPVQRLPRLLLAFYYPWFPGYTWSVSAASSDRPTAAINSLDPAAVAGQIRQAKSAGIDGFSVSYNSDWADDRLQVLLDAAKAQNFSITLNLETMDNPNHKVWPPETIKGWLVHAYQTFASQPAYLRVDGRPTVVLNASDATPLDTWRDMLASLRSQGMDWETIGAGFNLANLNVFDGLHTYAVNDFVADLAPTYLQTGIGVRNQALLDLALRPKIWAATVQPGFDSSPYGGSSPVVFERGRGDFYRSTFEAALQSNPDWIFITSWNEYGENTHVEPSQRDGDLFLQITREYAQKFKSVTIK